MEDIALKIGGTPIPTIPEKIPTGGLLTLEKTLQVSFSILIIAAILLAIFFILFSGIQWITSGGDKQKLQAARNRLTFAIVGLLIVFLAVLIVNLIGVFFNVKLIGL